MYSFVACVAQRLRMVDDSEPPPIVDRGMGSPKLRH